MRNVFSFLSFSFPSSSLRFVFVVYTHRRPPSPIFKKKRGPRLRSVDRSRRSFFPLSPPRTPPPHPTPPPKKNKSLRLLPPSPSPPGRPPRRRRRRRLPFPPHHHGQPLAGVRVRGPEAEGVAQADAEHVAEDAERGQHDVELALDELGAGNLLPVDGHLLGGGGFGCVCVGGGLYMGGWCTHAMHAWHA